MSGRLEGNGAGTELERNAYKDGQVLSAEALRRESEYFLARDRQHAVLAHSPGILSGLRLKQEGEEIVVTRGAAVDRHGRLILVPLNEAITIDLARSLPSGIYAVELLYQRLMAEGENGGACSIDRPVSIREGYRLQLGDADEPLPRLETKLDVPPDDPESEAPVTIGTIEWRDDTRMFASPLPQGRVYAGVIAESIAAGSDLATLELRDENDRTVLRTAPRREISASGDSSDDVESSSVEELEERLVLDPDGWVKVEGPVKVGSGGVELTGHGSTWTASLVASEDSGSTTFDDTVDEYKTGEVELRVVIPSLGSTVGRRRIVFGYDRTDGFKPAIVIYDRPGSELAGEFATVEIWGDLHVRGTAWLTRAVKETRSPSSVDDLDLILSQIFGPLGTAMRAWLGSDEEWLGTIASKVLEQLGAADVTQKLIKDLTDPETPASRIRIRRLCDALAAQCPPKFAPEPSSRPDDVSGTGRR